MLLNLQEKLQYYFIQKHLSRGSDTPAELQVSSLLPIKEDSKKL